MSSYRCFDNNKTNKHCRKEFFTEENFEKKNALNIQEKITRLKKSLLIFLLRRREKFSWEKYTILLRRKLFSPVKKMILTLSLFFLWFKSFFLRLFFLFSWSIIFFLLRGREIYSSLRFFLLDRRKLFSPVYTYVYTLLLHEQSI